MAQYRFVTRDVVNYLYHTKLLPIIHSKTRVIRRWRTLREKRLLIISPMPCFDRNRIYFFSHNSKNIIKPHINRYDFFFSWLNEHQTCFPRAVFVFRIHTVLFYFYPLRCVFAKLVALCIYYLLHEWGRSFSIYPTPKLYLPY